MLEAIGFRFCGMVDDPPRPDPPGSADLAHLGLHEEADIASDFSKTSRKNAAGTYELCQTVAVRVPGRIGITKIKQFRNTFPNFNSPILQGSQSAGSTAQLQHESI